jgi:hypothetical protein
VWDPIIDDRWFMPYPLLFHDSGIVQIHSGAVLCVAGDQDHVGMFFNRSRCRTPYIRKYLLKRNSRSTGGDGIWQLMTLGKLTRITNIRSNFWSVSYFISSKNLLNDK